MKVIVDTNVPIVANKGESENVSLECWLACVERLTDIMQNDTVVIDTLYLIIGEYENELDAKKKPGMGHQFLKWIYTHLGNPSRCEQVPITQLPDTVDGNDFLEYPTSANLTVFDRSDRKFVTLALVCEERGYGKVPILNAVDTDWAECGAALRAHGIVVDFLCPADIDRMMEG